jgi:hypothetical protein
MNVKHKLSNGQNRQIYCLPNTDQDDRQPCFSTDQQQFPADRWSAVISSFRASPVVFASNTDHCTDTMLVVWQTVSLQQNIFEYSWISLKFETSLFPSIFTTKRRSALQFQIWDSHSDSNMKIDQCLGYKMSNYSVSFYAINLLIVSLSKWRFWQHERHE